jgi:hypothetical protein
MSSSNASENERWDPEPRWPAAIAVAAVAGLYFALPHYLTIGPRWIFPVVVIALLIPTVVSHRAHRHRLNRVLGFTVESVLTAGLIAYIVLLIRALPSHLETPTELLISAAGLWFTNILVFALWYWRLDAGGPYLRDSRVGHPDGAFLFPQMTLSRDETLPASETPWAPNFIDYLFLSFNTSTAFSPTDAPVLARWAKVMTMLQAIISLTVLVLLAARAVNIL